MKTFAFRHARKLRFGAIVTPKPQLACMSKSEGLHSSQNYK